MSSTAPSLGPAFPLSVFTRLADPIRRQLLPIDEKRVLRLAERINGLHDCGQGGTGWRLQETIESVAAVDWNALGRFAVRYILNWRLGNHLRLVELFKRRPDIVEIEIERPIIITGLFRTGTTFLHNVLAADPAHRAARMWELAHPVGRRRDLVHDDRWRRWRAGHEVAMDDLMIPEQAEAHQVTVDALEEDFFLLENDMAVLMLCVGLGDYRYGMRMLDWDMLEPYQSHKRQLQLLWAQAPAERWLLKSPWHLWNLHALLTVYPDACVIQTHREPVSIIGSQCSLSGRIASKFQRRLDLREVGRFWIDYSRLGIERGLEARSEFPNAQIHDVRLSDLHARPFESIAAIYRHFDLPMDDAAAARIKARIEDEPKAQVGEHAYDIADYGLSAPEIEEAFSDYRQLFDL